MSPEDFKTSGGDRLNADSIRIEPEMTVLDVIHRYRDTEAVFRHYDDAAGECICCRSLFETLADVSEKYGIDLDKLITDIRQAATK